MEKKYTMKEFETMFIKAQAQTITKLEKAIKEKDTKHKLGAMASLAFTMQNMMVISELYEELFKGEENNE